MTTGGIGNNPGGWFGPSADSTRSAPNDRPDTPLGFNITPLRLPQDMKTLVYSPQVRVVIAHGNTQYDVSKDLISGTVIRRENAASSLFFTVANIGNYNTAFARMDRVVVWMKRIRWEQVFAGYLDTVPYRQLYGGAAEFKATCTLKRLLYTYWNPGLPASASLLDQLTLGKLAGGDGQLPVDQGLGDILREILTRVGGWQLNNIYVQKFPMQFWDWMRANVMANVGENRAQVDQFQHLLLGVDWNTYAPGQYAGYAANAGAPGAPGSGEAYYIAEIVAACDAKGMGPTTVDLKNSAALQDESVQAAADDRQDRPAWTQVGQTMTTWNQSTVHNDAAVLGVAAAMVETGGGATIMNWANAAVPDSLRFLNDGLPPTGGNLDSVGIFQQRANWGLVSQRMNPRQAASLFFTALSRQDWRNADPGQAIFNTQMGGSPEAFNAAIALAQQKVLAYREAQAGVTSTTMATPVGQAASSVADATGIGTDALNAAAASVPQSTNEAKSRVGKPDPDSEGAVMTVLEQAGKPYQWGGEGPASFDCSGLMVYAYRSIGIEIPHFTGDMRDTLPHVPLSNIQRGDLIITSGGNHVVMYIGPGNLCFAASTYGVPVGPVPMPAEVDAVLHVAENGGPDPSAPRFDPILAGPGVSPGTGQWAGSGTGLPQTNEPVALNLFAWMFIPSRFVSDTAMMFKKDHKEFIDSQPLMRMVKAIAGASLRNFASAPNGDFMAYYPDYFGLDGKPAILRLEDIELKDVRVNFSDDELTTHVYINGDYTHGLADPNQVWGWLDTAGSVTVEHEWLFQRLTKIAPGDLGEFTSGEELMRRFGARPLQQTFTMAGSYELEFLLAAHIFQEKWARQYQTSVAFTFMPELFPGMRVLLADHNLQVYVSEVTHCLRGSERFLTKDGTKTLVETVGTSQMVLGHHGEWTLAEIKSFGDQELFRIILSRYGREKEVFVTATHRWFKARKRTTGRPPKGQSKWIEATTVELSSGDILRSMFKIPHSAKRLSPIGIQAGIVFGDGTVHQRHRTAYVRLHGEKDRQLLKWFPLNHTRCGIHPGGNHVQFTEVLDLPAYFKQPPPLNESASYLYGWLAGYFAADGNVTSYRGSSQAFLSSASEEHIQIARDVCHILGIRTFSILTRTQDINTDCVKQEDYKSHRLQLDIEDLPEDFFLIEDHRQRAMTLQSRWNSKGRRKLQDWVVKSIEPTGIIEEVFCAMVPEGHAFTLEDNILTGNSWHFEQGFQTSAVIMAPSSPNAGPAMSSVGGSLGPNNTSVLKGLGLISGDQPTPMTGG